MVSEVRLWFKYYYVIVNTETKFSNPVVRALLPACSWFCSLLVHTWSRCSLSPRAGLSGGRKPQLCIVFQRIQMWVGEEHFSSENFSPSLTVYSAYFNQDCFLKGGTIERRLWGRMCQFQLYSSRQIPKTVSSQFVSIEQNWTEPFNTVLHEQKIMRMQLHWREIEAPLATC